MDTCPIGFQYPVMDDFPGFSPKLKIGILASGDGSNFEAIATSINNLKLDADIKLLIVNNAKSNAINRAKRLGIDFQIIDHKSYNSREEFDIAISKEFKAKEVEGIVMAGWMRIITNELLSRYQNRIINLHPSLLPSFVGKNAISQAMENGSLITGCSTHFVSLDVDSGPLIAQAAVPIMHNSDLKKIRESIRYFEHKILPMSIAIAGTRWRSF